MRPGCFLASVLFVFYINRIVSWLDTSDLHPSKLVNEHILIILYADNALIFIKESPQEAYCVL